MPPTNNVLNPAAAPTITGNIVPMRSAISQEKHVIPERTLEAIKRWKSELLFSEAECKFLRKMIKWNRTARSSYNGKIICEQFIRMTTTDLPALIAKMNTIESEIIVTLTNNAKDLKTPLFKFQKLEKELKEFKENMGETKLYLLEEMANTTRISIF
ncbi:MAG: hypothetical protein AAFZ15_31205 [Bacteroidota bacterium]